MLKAQFDEYEKLGVAKVTVHANIDVGGYAWARFGFVPDQDGWNDLRKSLKQRVTADAEPVTTGAIGPSATPAQRSWHAVEMAAGQAAGAEKRAVNKILNDPDPKAIWKLADARIGDRNIGKELLMERALERRDPARRRRRDGTFQPLHRASKMTIIFDGPPGTKLGEGEIDGMHELLADDDFPSWELSRRPDEDEDLEKAAAATLSAADAAERKVAERIYTALRAAALAADQIAEAAHRMMTPDAAVGALRRSGLGPALRHGDRPAAPGDGSRRPPRRRRRNCAAARCTIGEGRRRARLKVNIGQRNGKIASFLDQYRMDKIREISDEQEAIDPPRRHRRHGGRPPAGQDGHPDPRAHRPDALPGAAGRRTTAPISRP